jgi:hypothetical protein
MHDDAQVALSVCAHISRMVRSSAGKPTVWCSVKATSPMDLRSSAGPAHGRPLGLMQRVDAKFSDGALSVDLSPLRDVDLALPTITRVLNVRAGGGDSVSHLVVDALRTRNELLVLDAAVGLAELLSSCPGLKLLATSREPSGSRWEHLHHRGHHGLKHVSTARQIAAPRSKRSESAHGLPRQLAKQAVDATAPDDEVIVQRATRYRRRIVEAHDLCAKPTIEVAEEE